ncbi:hypothetical protein M569_14110 [Genlisea aurea]|uniref:Alpha/beta hydrolase fold-3 domain-containing protein n=1 Tax=Genlisea aurea TaxID=192259 RepID=S8C1P3_9LAMI|nr:hypothetical protein M569_14110 [Genlisea aurea]
MSSLPRVVEDILGIIQLFSDGTILRSPEIDFPMKVHDDGTAIWKDALFDEKNDLRLRLYRPRRHSGLPVLFYLRGGGFCIGSRTWPNVHTCCLRLASSLGVLVVAPDYRSAPENRLPAAVEDSVAALKWVREQAVDGAEGDEWLGNGVDFGRMFVFGDSSGGNLAHHLAVELRRGSPEFAPLHVRGYILMAPFFGGSARTKSEDAGPTEPFISVDLLDRFWRLSLPVGSTLDSPLSNPFGPGSPNLENVNLAPIMVMVGGNEVMKDRVEAYYERLKAMGKEIEYVVFEGQFHGFFLNESYSPAGDAVLQELNRFILNNSV